MNLVGTILLFTLSIPWMWQDDQKTGRSYTVTLEETGCASTRRMRCNYRFVKVSSAKEAKDKGHFNILFYMSADQTEGKEDAVSRLDRFFRIKREASLTPGVANLGTVGYKKPVTLRIQSSKYEFIREDGEKILVDIEKKTRP